MTKLMMLILLPAGVDAAAAKELVGRWQSEPIKAESGKKVTVEFRVLKEKPSADDVQLSLLSSSAVIVVDQVEAKKGYMVAYLIESAKDLGPGGGKRVLIEFSHEKGQYPLGFKVGELSARFARLKDDAPKPGEGKVGFEYLRVTSRQLREGTVTGLKYPADGAQGGDLLGALNYLGGQGWDVVFDGETLVCKRPVGGQTRWEYFVAKGYSDPEKADAMDKLLKEAGSTGWELTGVHDSGGVVIFKRPLAAAKDAGPKKEEPKREEFPSKPIIK